MMTTIFVITGLLVAFFTILAIIFPDFSFRKEKLVNFFELLFENQVFSKNGKPIEIFPGRVDY